MRTSSQMPVNILPIILSLTGEQRIPQKWSQPMPWWRSWLRTLYPRTPPQYRYVNLAQQRVERDVVPSVTSSHLTSPSAQVVLNVENYLPSTAAMYCGQSVHFTVCPTSVCSINSSNILISSLPHPHPGLVEEIRWVSKDLYIFVIVELNAAESVSTGREMFLEK